jgi:cytochrome c
MKGSLSMRASSRLVLALVLIYGAGVGAQMPTFKLGRTPTEAELRPADAAIGPDGEGLPAGRGTAKEGETTYRARGCSKCHGPTGTEGPGPVLVARESVNEGVARYPFAPMIWSWINQMMPLDLQMQHQKLGFIPRFAAAGGTGILYEPCCMKPEEVYAVTAYLLYRNGIIREDEVMDANSLPKVQMPRRDAFAVLPFLDATWKPGMRHTKSR